MRKKKKDRLQKVWSDTSLLTVLPNPSKEGYEITMTADKVTFLGVYEQPDFAILKIVFYPKKSIVELKSLKLYLQQFRQQIISYERLANVVYGDLKKVYKPERIRLEMETTSRGDISSQIIIDSDWAIRGGKEKFKDWIRAD